MDPVIAWFKTHRLSPGSVRPDADNAPFAQVVWARTAKVGCSRGRIMEGAIFVCVYSPPVKEGEQAYVPAEGKKNKEIR